MSAAFDEALETDCGVDDDNGALRRRWEDAVERLRVDLLRLDGGTQPRAKIDDATVAEYAEAMQAGAEFPPVIAFFDGTNHWVVDGHHRVRAAAKAGLEQIAVDVRGGTREDAVWQACASNATHGLRRTNADKRRAVVTALSSTLAAGLSDRAIAQHVGVSNNFVGEVRRAAQLSSDDSSAPAPTGPQVDQKRVGLDGKARTTSSVKRSDAAHARLQHAAEPASIPTPEVPLTLSIIEPPPTTPARRPRTWTCRRVLSAALVLSPEEQRALARAIAWHHSDESMPDGEGD